MEAKSLRALIVDDLPESRTAILERVDVLGHESDMASCVEEARKLLGKNDYDYVVLDLQIPNRKGGPDMIEYGMNFIDEIIAEHTYMAIVVVTAHGKTYSHVVEVMGKSPLVRYAPKPFTNDSEPNLTKMIREALEKAEEYRRAGLLPCALSNSRKKQKTGAVATIDIKVLRRKKDQQVFCLVEGEERPFSIREHEILALYVAEQAKRGHDPERHMADVNSDLFNINNDYNRRHSALSRFRSKLRKYLPEGHPDLLVNVSDRRYYLGCYCIDSTDKGSGKKK